MDSFDHEATHLTQKASVHVPFIRWFLINFSTREHFVRFLASAILLITVYYIVREKPIPEGWWGVFGVVIGYYFRGHTETEQKPKA